MDRFIDLYAFGPENESKTGEETHMQALAKDPHRKIEFGDFIHRVKRDTNLMNAYTHYSPGGDMKVGARDEGMRLLEFMQFLYDDPTGEAWLDKLMIANVNSNGEPVKLDPPVDNSGIRPRNPKIKLY